jgi:hypothetical protein
VSELSSLIDPRNPERARSLAEDAAYELISRNREAVGALAQRLYDLGEMGPVEIEQVLSRLPTISRCSIPDPTSRPAVPPPIGAPAAIEVHRRVDGWIGGPKNGAVRASLVDALRRREERQKLYDDAARNVLGAFEG